ncbi:MAG: hypothetical protein CFE23_16655 [Flavobacterium sp. BFFFF1]|uniref:hypothetical protein n=1 Tax=Flavobacterium sp. BFFFF1 TaxID=2015557 RepID=UPI000BDB1EB4|nr:hypothetical protein [Flavobacterium sp. BFFFF1]OYU78856.1 MAG: hypothetical protein CFE23_16655 [Flavobacterium sp. BFFFF1]
MKIRVLLFLFVSINIFGQNLENNVNLKKYRSVEITNCLGNKKTPWSTKIELNNGQILQKKIYYENKLRTLLKYTEEQSRAEMRGKSDLPELVERNSPFDSICGFRIEYKYDTAGNVIFEKTYSKIDKQILIETNSYKYDSHNNVIEINRTADPKQEYPIIMTGGQALYENEKFRYVYNNDGLWIKQYWIVDGKETLITKRVFK